MMLTPSSMNNFVFYIQIFYVLAISSVFVMNLHFVFDLTFHGGEGEGREGTALQHNSCMVHNRSFYAVSILS